MHVSTKVNLSSDFASWASWPLKSAAMVTLRDASFLSPTIRHSDLVGGGWSFIIRIKAFFLT